MVGSGRPFVRQGVAIPVLLLLAGLVTSCGAETTIIEGGDGEDGRSGDGDGEAGDGDGQPGDGDGDGDGQNGDGDGQTGDGDGQTGDGDGQTGDGDGDGQTGDGDGDGNIGGDGDASTCLESQTDNVAPSTLPPGGLDPQNVPQFVMFGFDDNAYVDGMNWVVNDLFGGKKNADGSPARATFFVIGGAATTEDAGIFNEFGGQTEGQLRDAWKNAFAAGHEIGNHSWDHLPNHGGKSLDLSGWQSEVDKAHVRLQEELGVPECQLAGLRFPYLEFNENGFQAMQNAGYTYDTSMEFGYDYWYPPADERGSLGEGQGYSSGKPESSEHFWWPFTLDEALPSNYQFFKYDVGTHAGVWEFPAHVFVKLNGDSVRNITGLDFNLWQTAANDTSIDFCDVLKQTFDQHYKGNRSPMNAGMHSDIYSQYNESADTWGINFEERRAGLACFLDYVLTKPDARVVTFKDVIRWMRNPSAL